MGRRFKQQIASFWENLVSSMFGILTLGFVVRGNMGQTLGFAKGKILFDLYSAILISSKLPMNVQKRQR